MSAPGTRTEFVLRINGSERRLRCAPDATLLEVLRDDLGLTGAKRGCNQGVCGACTVLVEGRPVRACLSLAVNSTSAEIQTIEGLADDPRMQTLREELITGGGLQCGFCTPGMLLAARALLGSVDHPDAEAVRDGLAGNLCRCSGYQKIVEAVVRAGAHHE